MSKPTRFQFQCPTCKGNHWRIEYSPAGGGTTFTCCLCGYSATLEIHGTQAWKNVKPGHEL
jgi:hypothetical protein